MVFVGYFLVWFGLVLNKKVWILWRLFVKCSRTRVVFSEHFSVFKSFFALLFLLGQLVCVRVISEKLELTVSSLVPTVKNYLIVEPENMKSEISVLKEPYR